MASNVIKLDHVRQNRQSGYMKRYRAKLDAFIQSRIPKDCATDLIMMAERNQGQGFGDPEMVWDYAELRETMLAHVTDQIARDMYLELQNQYWFDPRWIKLDAVAERCLSFMILGQDAKISAK